MNKKELLELREEIKAKKPDFARQDYHKRPKLSKKWRKPKGLHSKMRKKLKGYRTSPSPGYGSPKSVNGLHASGLRLFLISSIKDLEKIDSSNEGIVLSSTLGLRKRIEIIKKALENKITILNYKNPKQFLKIVEERLKKEKEEKETKTKEKERKKKEKEKKGSEKKKEKLEKLTEEEKKEEEKKEKDKLLTKKGA